MSVTVEPVVDHDRVSASAATRIDKVFVEVIPAHSKRLQVYIIDKAAAAQLSEQLADITRAES